jgi:ubiquinone/menaquinone biosynthesis C-methylase UbiE
MPDTSNIEDNGGTAGTFDRAAPTYARVGPDYFSHFGRRLVESVEIEIGAKVLDVAAGSGAVLLPASKAIGSEGFVVGIDLSYQMVKRLREEIARQQLSNARALLMDANRMAFRDRSFDYVLCSFALDSLSDQNRALLEFRRLVGWDGQIGLAISSSWWWEEDERWEWFAQLLDSLEITVRSGPRPLGTLEEVEAALENAGLVGVSATEETFDLAFADEEEWWKWGWSHGWRRVLEAVDDATLEHYRSACIERLRSSRSPGIEGRLKTIVAFARPPRR